MEFNYALGCIACVDSKVNLISLILPTIETHPVLFNIHASNHGNCSINLGYSNAALLNAERCQLMWVIFLADKGNLLWAGCAVAFIGL